MPNPSRGLFAQRIARISWDDDRSVPQGLEDFRENRDDHSTRTSWQVSHSGRNPSRMLVHPAIFPARTTFFNFPDAPVTRIIPGNSLVSQLTRFRSAADRAKAPRNRRIRRFSYILQLRCVVEVFKPVTRLNHQRQYDDGMTVVLPVVGIYSCLFCDWRFASKVNLKHHYREIHANSIPDYRGSRQAAPRERKRVARTFRRMTRYCRSMPVVATQLAIVLVTLLIYSNS